ncbi:MAG: VOC family protein [Candidatus Hydrogenedentales bacterium]
MPFTINCISLPVDNLKRSLRFYRECFALSIPEDDSPDQAADHCPILLPGGLYLVLILRKEFSEFTTLAQTGTAAAGASECILSYFARTADEVDAIAARCARAGGTVASGAQTREWGYAALLTDPDAHIWEVLHNENLTKGE